MKVLMVITGMRSGGAERVMATLCNELSQKHDVRLLCMKENETDYLLDDKVKFLGANVKNKSFLKSVNFVKKNIKTWNPDVILSFMTKSNLIALVAKKISKKNVPVIIAERTNPFIASFKRIRKIIYPWASGAVFQTKQAQQYYKNIIKCESVVLRNPLNPDFAIEPFKGKREKRIVSVGRLSDEKNQKLIISSFSKIADRYPEYKVEIYGEGPLKKELQAQIDEFGLSSQIVLMGRKDNIQEHIRTAEIFVLPSNSEGMPNALLEAMALGCACIATDCPIGGSAFIIKNEKNGILIPMNDENKMTTELERLMTDCSFAQQLGEKAKKVIQDFSSEKVCSEWEAFICKIALYKGKRTENGNS
ncbi:MAG: glycosyltransferase [Anaerostipes sp.]|jgi:GalNAc-alpha-(1->4)-GalNAc-alpha-(1->3)-diNAcBac-PP-undecaprenol alpha-1,4-N-acetyl-D-galactosaminyltransferase|nr:glycosyltransferase [Anaerostipes sp.]